MSYCREGIESCYPYPTIRINFSLAHITSADLAKKIRKSSLAMTAKGRSSHIGSVLSCADILAVLYSNVLKLHPNTDYFIMSKGHASAGLYSALAHVGIIEPSHLATHYQNGSMLSGHVSHHLTPYIPFSTGSLGHGLPIATGVAYRTLYFEQSKRRTYCLLSDGELQEGSNWEAFLFAAHHKLNNLVCIIDRNNLQSITTTEQTIALEPLSQKFSSFGWSVSEIDGHDHQQLCKVLLQETAAPHVIIAKTTKGKGVSFMENSVLWHYRSPSTSELNSALEELEAQNDA